MGEQPSNRARARTPPISVACPAVTLRHENRFGVFVRRGPVFPRVRVVTGTPPDDNPVLKRRAPVGRVLSASLDQQAYPKPDTPQGVLDSPGAMPSWGTDLAMSVGAFGVLAKSIVWGRSALNADFMQLFMLVLTGHPPI